MRMCINSVGNGDIDTPFEVSQFLRQVYDGFSFIGNTGPYEVSKKLYTLKQSLVKVENAFPLAVVLPPPARGPGTTNICLGKGALISSGVAGKRPSPCREVQVPLCP